MIGLNKINFKSEKGAVQIVEATFVFPIMFIILFFLIYMGNAHYIKSNVEKIVQTYAIEGASYCQDPILDQIEQTGSVPSLENLNAEPYRYLIGGMDNIENDISRKVKDELESQQNSFFNTMNAQLSISSSDIAKFNNYFIYSTFSVEVEYDIKMPIKFMGASSPPILTINSRAEVPINDSPEFIRNTDMVVDMLDGTLVSNTVESIFEKLNEFLGSFAGL